MRPPTPCTGCDAPHSRYFHLCLACDPAPRPVTPPACVWPLRCYCPEHRGRARKLQGPPGAPGSAVAAALSGQTDWQPHRYGYVMWHHLGIEHARGECEC